MSLFSKLQSFFARPQQSSLMVAAAIVEQLIDLGFMKFTPESEREVVRQQLIESVRDKYLDSEWSDECVSADRRSFSADAEDLAEGSVGICLRQMSEILSQEGVVLESVKDSFANEHKRYEVIVNGVSYLIYDLNEHSIEEIWNLAFRRIIEIVNLLLTQAGSSERLFGIYGGNDARVIFLTESMHDLLCQRIDIFDAGWKPVKASEIQ